MKFTLDQQEKQILKKVFEQGKCMILNNFDYSKDEDIGEAYDLEKQINKLLLKIRKAARNG